MVRPLRGNREYFGLREKVIFLIRKTFEGRKGEKFARTKGWRSVFRLGDVERRHTKMLTPVFFKLYTE